MLYMIVETFRNGDPLPTYHGFRDQGRLMPEGLEYRGDITDFEVIPVVTSAEAAGTAAPRL
jgi:hypothetical protein